MIGLPVLVSAGEPPTGRLNGSSPGDTRASGAKSGCTKVAAQHASSFFE